MKKPKIRIWIQLAFFVLVALIATNHGLEESGREIPVLGAASMHAICPFGGVVSIYQWFASGTIVKKVHESSFVLMGIAFVSALLLGPVFCGWVCPFGTFQEFLARIGKRIFKRRYNNMVPRKVDRILRYLRYVLLALVLYNTAMAGKLIFADVDPYYALFQFWTGEVAITAYIALAVVILLSLIIERPFCKYACPYGAVLGIFNLFRIFGLKRNTGSCINCKACDRSCPMNLDISTKEVVRNHQCISCFQCTSGDGSCPVKETLEFKTGKYIQEEKA